MASAQLIQLGWAAAAPGRLSCLFPLLDTRGKVGRQRLAHHRGRIVEARWTNIKECSRYSSHKEAAAPQKTMAGVSLVLWWRRRRSLTVAEVEKIRTHKQYYPGCK